MRRLGLLLALAALLAAGCGGARGLDAEDTRGEASAAKRLRLLKVGTFSEPVYATSPSGDTSRVFVVERAGRIRLVKNGRKLARPFLDIRRLVGAGGSEQGLLSVAFSPRYRTTGRFYVFYTGNDDDERIVEFRRSRANPDRVAKGSARRLLRVPDDQLNHNGGQLQFGPDGLLYAGLGDGGGQGDLHGPRGNGQDKSALLGKILRIDPRAGRTRPYRIPATNPFAGATPGRGEVYAYGLRNPWRFSFDRRTGAMTIGDVGDCCEEEVDFAAKGRGRGANWGWRVFEGTRRRTSEPAPGARRPVLVYGHGGGRCSVTGGYVARDRALGPLYGDYVYGDFCEGRLRAARLSSTGATRRRYLGPRVEALSSFGENARGQLLVVSLAGPVYRLAYR